MNRRLLGTIMGVLTTLALGAIMLPFRSHLAVATAALILVIPVVTGVSIGGFVSGLTGVIAGFLVYDIAFIPPYWTINVGAAQNWVALGVYGLVMIVISRVVGNLNNARSASQRRATDARRLFHFSELLLGDHPTDETGHLIVDAVREAFKMKGVALLQPVNHHLRVVASSGQALTDHDLEQLQPEAKRPVALSTKTSDEPIQALALATADRTVGLLVLQGLTGTPEARELLPTLANHIALALERAQLREQAVRVELLEEIDRLRRALIGAVSHDLRTPLATIKVASTALLNSSVSLPETDVRELYALIDQQTDRLTRLVHNLLDMTRIQAGVLEIRREPWSMDELVRQVVTELETAMEDRVVHVDVPTELPIVDIDHLLIEQVLSNLLENAHRHGVQGTDIVVSARAHADEVEVSVTDRGPGVLDAEKSDVFETFVRFDTGGRSGLGLAIAKAFVEAHGGRIWVEDPPSGGARFLFTVTQASRVKERE